MTAPGGDWVEQARRLVAGLATDPVATASSATASFGTAPFADWAEQARRLTAEHRLAERLQEFLGAPHGPAPSAERARTASRTAGPADPADADRSDAGPSGGTRSGGTSECRGCPLCAGLAALRGRRPDLTEALADVLAAAATALRGDGGTPDSATPDTATPDTATPDPATPSSAGPNTTPRTTPDGSDAGTDVPAPDVPTGDAPAAPEKTVPHPAPAPVQRIDVA